jgi:hypothetical protein
MARSHDSEIAAGETFAVQLANGWRWTLGGFAELRRDPPLWLGMAVLYLLPAVVVSRIPFAGPLVVLLLSPMLLAGALLACENPELAPMKEQTDIERWLRRPARALFSAIIDEKHVYPTVLLGIVTVGLVVLMFILEHLFGLGSVRNLLAATARHTAPLWSIAVGLLGAAILHVLLLMGLLYAAHRSMLHGRDPMTAIADSFAACMRQPFALLALAGPFALLYVLIIAAFGISALFGYLLLFTAGLIALPAFVAATVCSYRDVFPAPAVDR